MLELTVAASYRNKKPAVILKHLENLAHFHQTGISICTK